MSVLEIPNLKVTEMQPNLLGCFPHSDPHTCWWALGLWHWNRRNILDAETSAAESQTGRYEDYGEPEEGQGTLCGHGFGQQGLSCPRWSVQQDPGPVQAQRQKLWMLQWKLNRVQDLLLHKLQASDILPVHVRDLWEQRRSVSRFWEIPTWFWAAASPLGLRRIWTERLAARPEQRWSPGSGRSLHWSTDPPAAEKHWIHKNSAVTPPSWFSIQVIFEMKDSFIKYKPYLQKITDVNPCI